MKAKVTKDEFLKGARAEIKKRFSSQVEAARHFGVEPSYLCAALKGTIYVPSFLLDFMGYKKEQIFVRSNGNIK